MPARETVALVDWKKAPKSGVLLHKQYTVKATPKEGDPSTVEFCISTAAVDRMEDTIAVAGWKTENYRKNPIVLWGHDRSSPPIGKSLKEWTTDVALNSECQFTPKDLNPFGAMIGEMVRAGYLNAVSVGFDPIKYAINEERGGSSWCPPCDFLEQELLEYSVVTIPANPEALVGAKQAGIDLKPMIEHAERVLSQVKGFGFWLSAGDVGPDGQPTRKAFERAYEISSGGRKIIVFGQRKDAGQVEQPGATDDDEAPQPKYMVGESVTVELEDEDNTTDTAGVDQEIRGEVRSAQLCYVYEVEREDTGELVGPLLESQLSDDDDDEVTDSDEGKSFGGVSKGAVPFKKLPLDTSDTWDGSAAETAMRKLASSDGSGDPDKIDFAKLRKGYCWFDSAKPNELGSYKLPNCTVKDGRLTISKKGTEEVAASLEGSRGQKPDIPESDIPGIKRRVQKTYKLWGGSAPWENQPKHAVGDRVKVDNDGHGPGTVKELQHGHFCGIEYDDAKGELHYQPQDKVKRHKDPAPAPADDSKALADAILAGVRAGVQG